MEDMSQEGEMASESLKFMLEKVHSGKTVLPEFQRDFVWGQAAVVKLMTSIFNGYPIGSLLIMENNDAYSSRAIDGVKVSSTPDKIDQDLILDGQQRVTSCYRAFYGTLDREARNAGRYYFKYKDYVEAKSLGDNPDGSSIEDYFEFIKPQRVIKSLNNMAHEISAGLLPLDIILQEPRDYSYAKWLGQYNFSVAKGDSKTYEMLGNISADFQTSFIERVTGYQVNYEKITRDTNPDVICTIFETINTTGVKLTVFDLLVAKCFKSEIKLRDLLDEAVEKRTWINKFDPEGKLIATIQLPRILGQLIKKECKKGVILELKAEDIASQWNNAVNGLEKALDVLYNRYGAVTPDWIPSTDMITPLAVLMSDPKFSSKHLNSLDKWYWRCTFGQYFRGAPETKISRTLREIQGPNGWLSGGIEEPDAVVNFQFLASSIDDATKNTTVYKGLMTLMLSSKPFDIGHERKKLAELSETEIHDHHIFPQKFLKDNGVKGAASNQILNRMPIWKTTNERISSYAPHVYFADFTKVHAEAKMELAAHYAVDPTLLEGQFTNYQYDLFLLDRKDRFITMVQRATECLPADIVQAEDS